jgi:hypothetical protein
MPPPDKAKPEPPKEKLSHLIESNQVFSLDESIKDYRRLVAGYGPRSDSKRNIFVRLMNAYTDHRVAMNNPLKLRDYELKWRVYARKRYGRAFFVILLLQNAFVIWLVYSAYIDNRLEQLSLILGVLVAATLTETYFIFRIIVTQLFKEIRYKDYIDKDK